MDIAAWLRGLGLERYAEAFRANEITAEALPELTDADLRELGLPLGPRRVLLKAIRDLAGPARPAASGEPAREQAELKRPPLPEAERRQLTVMFVDLVGSTALAGRLDPEDMGAVIRAYQDACAGVITRFEGHVAKYLGDGVLAYFGYPRAHEDAAERAVRAGLEIIEVVGRLAAPDAAGTPLAARVGIATGLVVAGELVGRGEAQERAVIGETPNLAARLQALAEPGTVVIGPTTWRLVGGLFELADVGAHDLKGFAAPVRAWRVLGLGAAQGRFEARQAAGLTPLVGREAELALLLGRWERAKEGEGQVVLLSGEPGIGKSRLTRALREQLRGERYTALAYQCSPYHTHSALHPVIDQLERAAGFERDDPEERRLVKLEVLLAESARDLGAVAPLLAALLAIPTGERYPPLNLTPQRQKELTLRALVGQLEELAAERPVLVMLEDAHWSDPTTQELFGLVIDRVRDLPALVVVTFRPEFTPPWPGHAHVTLLTLSRLSRRQGAALVERVTGGKALPEEAVAQIVARTDGVPLFVEELTKAVLESGLLHDEGERYTAAGPLPALAIPSTLQDSLLARLDRLAPVKEAAQIGAALGREFSHELLTAVADRPEPELAAALDQLVASELIFRRGTPPDATYSFKHALVQDAAYGTLLKSRRQQLHGRIAEALETRFPEVAEQQPESLARHLTEAGLAEKAVAYWHKAGQLAVRRSAMAEASRHLTTALSLLSKLPASAERGREELEVQLALGGVLLTIKGWASSEMHAAYTRARELCREVGESHLLFPTLFGLFTFHQNRAEHQKAYEVAAELLRLAERQRHAPAELLGHRILGAERVFLGEFAAAIPHLERVVASYDPKHHAFSFVPHDSGLSSRNFLAWARLFQGHPDQALAYSQQMMALAREINDPYNLAFALHVSCLFHQARGARAVVEERAAELVALAAEQEFPHMLGTGTFFRGWARTAAGRVEEGIAEMRRGLAAKRATGAEIKVPYYLGLIAAADGRPDEAMPALDEALEMVNRTGERWFEAELHRLRGEVLLRTLPADHATAEASFRNAVDVARAQGAKWWELRATTSRARLWRDQGKPVEARDLLAPIYGWFTEGFDTPDLREANALLGELG